MAPFRDPYPQTTCGFFSFWSPWLSRCPLVQTWRSADCNRSLLFFLQSFARSWIPTSRGSVRGCGMALCHGRRRSEPPAQPFGLVAHHRPFFEECPRGAWLFCPLPFRFSFSARTRGPCSFYLTFPDPDKRIAAFLESSFPLTGLSIYPPCRNWDPPSYFDT